MREGGRDKERWKNRSLVRIRPLKLFLFFPRHCHFNNAIVTLEKRSQLF